MVRARAPRELLLSENDRKFPPEELRVPAVLRREKRDNIIFPFVADKLKVIFLFAEFVSAVCIIIGVHPLKGLHTVAFSFVLLKFCFSIF